MRKGYEMKVRIDRTFELTMVKSGHCQCGDWGLCNFRNSRCLILLEGPFCIRCRRNVYEKDGEKHYSDIFHPITAEAREALNEAVMGAYEEAIAESEEMDEALPFGPGM